MTLPHLLTSSLGRTVLAGTVLAGACALPIPAWSQTDQERSLRDALSLISSGALDGVPMQMTQDGDQIHVRIPLPQLAPPPEAAIDATASRRPSGVWDITSWTLPPAGTLFHRPGTAPHSPPLTAGYTIGEQSGHARIDPTLASPSAYQLDLGKIVVHDSLAKPGEHLTFGNVSLSSTVTGEGHGLVTTLSHVSGADWQFAGRDQTGFLTTMSLRSFELRSDIHGFDRARAAALRAVLAANAQSRPVPPPPPGRPGAMSPLQRRQLRAMIDASADLMSSFDTEETFDGFHIVAPRGSVDIGQVRLAMAGNSSNGRVAAHFDLGVTDLAVPGAPPSFAPMVPRQVALRFAIAGIPAPALRAFLRAAIAPDTDPATLRAQAMALLALPGARAGVESLSATIGPMQLTGSARVHPLPDGTAAIDLHLSATGLDTLLQSIEADPQTRRALPVLLVARGLGKPEGDHILWDIGLAHGVATVNGIPLGRPDGGIAEAPPAAHR